MNRQGASVSVNNRFTIIYTDKSASWRHCLSFPLLLVENSVTIATHFSLAATMQVAADALFNLGGSWCYWAVIAFTFFHRAHQKVAQ